MKLLFFTPHAALWEHTAPEAYMARALTEYGHTICYLSCGMAQSYCAPMTAYGFTPGCTPSESEHVCSKCMAAINAISRVYRFQVDTLARNLVEEDFSRLDNMAAEAVCAKSLDSEYLGVKVGRMALYELTLMHKKMSVELNQLQWNEYHVYLSNALRSLQAFAKYIETNPPDCILSFSPQYSNINPCTQYAINKGIRVLFIESGTNLSHRLGTMRVWDWKIHKLVNPALHYWKKSALNPVTSASAAKVIAHFKQLFRGQHFAVFSAPIKSSCSLRVRLQVKPEQKILLMTLSSYDEAYAALLIDGFPSDKVFSDVFYNQAEWIKAMLDWVADRSDLFLVIRVHPRDFPNKRENFRSEQSFILEKLLKHIPINVYVNWPDDGLSLYNLLEDTNLMLTGWSVTGIEALVLGIPIVTYDSNLPSYPSDIQYTGRSQAEYFANIDRALADGWSFENVINGFRWMAYNFVTCTIPVSTSFGAFDDSSMSKIHTLFNRVWLRLKNSMPSLRYFIELHRWRGALAGSHFVSVILEQGHDALPPAQEAIGKSVSVDDEKSVVIKSLSILKVLLYAKTKPPNDRPGLYHNINSFLAREGLQ